MAIAITRWKCVQGAKYDGEGLGWWVGERGGGTLEGRRKNMIIQIKNKNWLDEQHNKRKK